MRDVTVLGSTGSVGTQALEVIARNPDRFRVAALGAGGGDIEALAAQVLRHSPSAVAVARAGALEDLTLALYAHAGRMGYSRGEWRLPRLSAGPQAMAELAAAAGGDDAVVLNALPGAAGLAPTLAALAAGATVALANKESLVAGGALVRRAAGGSLSDRVVPVDSEHSALAQCLRGGRAGEVRRLVLTASGGPFRGRTREDLARVTVEQAMAHPTWRMGPLVTINSATLVNKGLETIEAAELFGVPYDALGVVVHPQSIVHSMVEFVDGSTLAQLSPPDMRLPIAVALGWPDRVPDAAPTLALDTAVDLHFEPLDEVTFPAVALAHAAGRAGGTAPAVYNAASEQAVAGFLAGACAFLSIVDTVERVLAEHEPTVPRDLDDVLAADAWARRRAAELTGGPAPAAIATPEVRA